MYTFLGDWTTHGKFDDGRPWQSRQFILGAERSVKILKTTLDCPAPPIGSIVQSVLCNEFGRVIELIL